MLNPISQPKPASKNTAKRPLTKRALLLTLCATLGLSQVTPTHAFDWDRLSFNQKAGVCAAGAALVGLAIYGLYRLCRTTDQDVIDQCQRLINQGADCFSSRPQFARLYEKNETVVSEEVLINLNLSDSYTQLLERAEQLYQQLFEKMSALNKRQRALLTARDQAKSDAARAQLEPLLRQIESIQAQYRLISPQLNFIRRFIEHNQWYFRLQQRYAAVRQNFARLIARETFDFARLTDQELEHLGLGTNYHHTINNLACDLRPLEMASANPQNRNLRLVAAVRATLTNLTPKLAHLQAHTDFFALRSYHSRVQRQYRNILENNNFNPEHLRIDGDYTAIIAYRNQLAADLELLQQKQRTVPQTELRQTVAATVTDLQAGLELIQTSDRYNRAVIRLKTTEAAYAAGKTGELLYQTLKPKNKNQEDDPEAAANAEAQAHADAHNRDAAIRAAAELAGLAAAASYRRGK